MREEKIEFENANKLGLAGVLHEPEKDTDAVVIIVHGFTSNKDRPRHVRMAETLALTGIAAFRIDLGGSGESADRPITVAGESADLRAAITHVKERGYHNIGIVGESLGGLVALSVPDADIRTMVLWAPATKPWDEPHLSPEQKAMLEKDGYFIREKFGRKMIVPQEYVDERTYFDRDETLRGMRVPVLIIHSPADKLVSINDSEEAIKLLPQGSKLEKIDNWEHGDYTMDIGADAVIQMTAEWFREHLGSAA